MALGNLGSKLKQAVADKKNEQIAKQEAEEARLLAILNGQIEPIKVVVNLDTGEQAYAEFDAKRMALVESVVEKTVGKTKKKGVITRAVVGGVLLGPLGAVGGAATAGSKGKSTTTQQVVKNLATLDSGKLILTNKRVIFVGRNVFSLLYSDVLAVSFSKAMSGQKVSFKYEGMEDGEFFNVSGSAARDSEIYYKGIQDHLVK